MANYKIILYDVDGVLNRPEELFSHQYAKEHNVNADSLELFFKGDFRLTSVGKADLKEQLEKYNHVWQWPGGTDELLELWFESENCPDNQLLREVAEQRRRGIKVCVATVQEKYRAAYMRNVMFPGRFDEYFISCDVGYLKTDPQFFQTILDKLQKGDKTLLPSDVIYFDDNEEGLTTARALGIEAYLYKDIEQIRTIVG